jgi:4,5-dihydroxyphthalate decarboxylase
LRYEAHADLGSLFRRICREAPYDVCELSLSNFMTLRANGDERLVGIPVFPSRSFRHSQIYLNADSGITRPEELSGKRIGIPEYHMTAGLWIRAILEDEFGVSPEDVEWVTPADALAYAEEMDFPVPAEVRLEPAAKGETLDSMLEAGAIDALVTVRAPESYERRSKSVIRLFPDYREVEEAYFRRTRHFPIMHTVVVRRDVYGRRPALARELLDAFEDAKRVGFMRLTDLNAIAIVHPWIGAELAVLTELFRADPFAYGVPANEDTLRAMIGYHFHQGLSRRRLALEELFAPETLDWMAQSDLFLDRRW